MPAMTMPFVVLERDVALLQAMTPGDSLSAMLVVSDSRYWLESLVLVKPAVPSQGRAPPPGPGHRRPATPCPTWLSSTRTGARYASPIIAVARSR